MLRVALQRLAPRASAAAQGLLQHSCHAPAGPGLALRGQVEHPLPQLAQWHRALNLSAVLERSEAAKSEPVEEPLEVGKADKNHAEHRDYTEGHVEPHRGSGTGKTRHGHPAENYWLHQPVYEPGYCESITPRHKEPKQWHEKTAFWAVTAMRYTFDKLTNYGPKMTETKWLIRILFLETVAGVPGMVGAMFRHLHSLRAFQRDNGWIHTLLEEAENERMHLLTFMNVTKPGPFMRGMVLVAQGVFFNLYSLFYIISPRHCHAFVGYLEEEAVKTYTHCLADIDNDLNGMGKWASKEGPDVAIRYWDLKPGSSLRDVVLQVRADEACHSHVNHTFSVMKASEKNPFQGPKAHVIP